MSADNRVERRLQSLEAHLKQENPVLDGIIGQFRHLDQIARRLGYLDKDQSHTYHMPWWPLISVLGTYSSGKSAFINYMLGYPLQPTGKPRCHGLQLPPGLTAPPQRVHDQGPVNPK